MRKECIMSVYVIGATGFTGSAIVRELPVAGHQGHGLALPGGAASLLAARAWPHRGTVDEPGTPAEIAAGLA